LSSEVKIQKQFDFNKKKAIDNQWPERDW